MYLVFASPEGARQSLEIASRHQSVGGQASRLRSFYIRKLSLLEQYGLLGPLYSHYMILIDSQSIALKIVNLALNDLWFITKSHFKLFFFGEMI